MFLRQAFRDFVEDTLSVVWSPDSLGDSLRRELEGINNRIERFRDRELGLIGPALKAAFAATGCTEYLNEKTADHPGYIPGSNSIEYVIHDLRERARLMIDKLHEGHHAGQWRISAALHAAPTNEQTTIILSPRDYVLSMVLAEKDANAKHPWLASLAARELSGIDDASRKYALTVPEFRALRKKEGSLHKALTEAARHALDRKSVWEGKPVYEGAQTTAIEYYITRYLAYYENAVKQRGAEKFTVARMSDDDILAIGGSFGPNEFAGADGRLLPDFRDLPLTREHETRIAKLNEALGIADESALPFVSDALQTQGYSAESFIKVSQGKQSSLPQRAYLFM